MDKAYNHKNVEEKIYKTWEEKGYFKPEVNENGAPYSIILPPPNANAPLHFGHAMYVIEDILIRYHRMKGDRTLWLPGADHAGFETQFVFEQKLQAEGKSRFDFPREELYKKIWDFVAENRPVMEDQLRKLGFSLDWSRKKFTLDPDIVAIVYKTFKKLYDDGLVYRANRLVNYCTFDGTSFSDLEVVWEERIDPLYYIKYGPLVLATTRPETKFGDTAVAVHPDDKRYKQYVGKEIEIETVLGKAKIKVIADDSVDPKFGTGVVKITPAHDFNDYEVGKKHDLPMKQVIGLDGKMNEHAGKFAGIYAKQARKAIVEEMKKKGLIEKIDENYTHRIGRCYKCKNVLEPLPLEQWFIKMEPLAKLANEAVKKGDIKIFPANFEKLYFQFLKSIRDWNISRQVVWGIRIPAWFRKWKPTKELYVMGFHERVVEQVYNGKTVTYRLRDHGVKESDKFALENSQTEEIFGYGTIQKIEVKTVKEIDLKDPKHGAKYEKIRELIEAFQFHHADTKVTEDTKVWVYTYSFGKLENGEVHEIFIGENPNGEGWKQDEDVFDTWFSSSQWPFATLQTLGSDYETFYPTTVMETGYDILRWWVARMVMVGIYATGKVPFKNVVLHGLVNDPLGKKMSKSKGNVINPLELVEKYSADAVRFALVYGTALGNDQTLSFEKLEAMRHFSNKLWNMARFIEMKKPEGFVLRKSDYALFELAKVEKKGMDEGMVQKTNALVKQISYHLDRYNFHLAAETLYDFTWHEFADKYIENIKDRVDENSYLILTTCYLILLEILHPFMPFITEEIYQRLGFGDSLMIEKWPIA